MALTQTQIYQIKHAASLGQARLMAQAWGVGEQQLADILRGSGLETILTNIAQQHEEAGTPIPQQSQDIRKLLETNPQRVSYTAWGGIARPPTPELKDKIRTAPSLSQAVNIAKSYGISQPELGKILKGSWLESIYVEKMPAVEVTIPQRGIGSGLESGITIPITVEELQQIEQAEVKGECVGAARAYYTPKTYKVTLKDGSVILVEALDKESAQKKAEDKGYKVGQISRLMAGEIVTVREPTKKEPVDVVKDYIKEIGGQWKDEYRANGGYNIVLMLADARKGESGFLVRDLDKLFGGAAVHKASLLVDKNVVLPGGLLMDKEDFSRIPGRYQDILSDKGFTAYEQAVKDSGGWLTDESLNDLKEHDKEYGTNYYEIGKEEGYNAVMDAIKKDEAVREAALAKLDEYKTPKGEYNLLLARARGVSTDEMKKAGFEDTVVQWVNSSWEESRKTGIALPGEKNYTVYLNEDGMPNKSPYDISAERFEQLQSDWEKKRDAYISKYGKPASPALLYAEIGYEPKARMAISSATMERATIEGLSTLFFLPGRIRLPEVIVKDITPLQWAIGGAQLVAWAFPAIPKGVLPFVSAGAAGIFGYATAINWNKLSPSQRALAVTGTVLVALPVLAKLGVGRVIPKPSAVKVPGRGGTEITVWRGIGVDGKPIIGISKGKPTFSQWGIKKPTLAQIEKGWHPVTKIETTILGTEKALKQMGVSPSDIAKVKAVWQEAVPVFVRKKPPTKIEPVEILSGSQRLTPQEIATILKVSVQRWAKKIKLIYGSSTMRPQLQKIFRDWRKWHDIDIQTSMTAKELVSYTDDIIRELRRIGTKARVNPQQAGTIEKWVNNQWVKITDIHALDVIPESPISAEGAYGYIYAESPIKMKVPGIGDLRLMPLSETGLRKAGSITSFQINKIAPAPHRINDIADLYIIVLNYKGDALAEKVARVFGYTGDELLQQFAKTPHRWCMWTLSPSVKPSMGIPSVAIAVPASLVASMPRSLVNELKEYTPVTSPSASSFAVQVSPDVVRTISAGLPPVSQGFQASVQRLQSLFGLKPKISTGKWQLKVLESQGDLLEGAGALNRRNTATIIFPKSMNLRSPDGAGLALHELTHVWWGANIESPSVGTQFAMVKGRFNRLIAGVIDKTVRRVNISRKELANIVEDCAEEFMVNRLGRRMSGHDLSIYSDSIERQLAELVGRKQARVLRNGVEGIANDMTIPVEMSISEAIRQLPALKGVTITPSMSVSLPINVSKVLGSLAIITGKSPSASVIKSMEASIYPLSLKDITKIIRQEAPSVSGSVARSIAIRVLVSVAPLVSEGVSPSIIKSAISEALSPSVSGGVISPSVASSIASSVNSSLSVSVQLSPSVVVSPSPSPSVSVTPAPSLSITPSPSPSPSPSPFPSPYPYPYPYPAPKPVPVLKTTKEGKKFYQIKEGSIAWRQGLFWKYIPPPWMQEKPISLKYPPLGAKNIGEKTPAKTIQMIGKPKAKVPKEVAVDLGVVDIFISDYGRKIRFMGEGERTVVGKSLAGTTKGMSIPGIGRMIVKPKVKKKSNGKRPRKLEAALAV